MYSRIVENNIDNDHDGFVTEEEMNAWLKLKNRESIMKNVETRWSAFSFNDTISLDEYLSAFYQSLDDCNLIFILQVRNSTFSLLFDLSILIIIIFIYL